MQGMLAMDPGSAPVTKKTKARSDQSYATNQCHEIKYKTTLSICIHTQVVILEPPGT